MWVLHADPTGYTMDLTHLEDTPNTSQASDFYDTSNDLTMEYDDDDDK